MYFLTINHKDASASYVRALIENGHEQVRFFEAADFVLYDVERHGPVHETLERYLSTHHGFIYPHTPYSFFLWDGLYAPLPVDCNFVVAEGAKIALEKIGYPYRVEVCGFSHCAVEEFKPTTGTRLLFAPPHPLGCGVYSHPGTKIDIMAAWEFILKHKDAFESITVRYGGRLDENGLTEADGVEYCGIDPYRMKSPARDFAEYLKDFDIVVSGATAGYIAVASGKPTVMFEGDIPPSTAGGTAQHYDLYHDITRFPLDIKDLTFDEIMEVREAPNPKVEDWKALNIGTSFQPEKFTGIVNACLEDR